MGGINIAEQSYLSYGRCMKWALAAKWFIITKSTAKAMSMENPFGSKNITDRCLRVEVDLLTELNKMEAPHHGQPAKKKAGIKSAKQSVANIQHIRS